MFFFITVSCIDLYTFNKRPLTNLQKTQILLLKDNPVYVAAAWNLDKVSGDIALGQYFQRIIYPNEISREPLSLAINSEGINFFFEDSKAALEFINYVEKFQNNFFNLQDKFNNLSDSQQVGCFFQTNISEYCYPVLMQYLKDFGYIHNALFLSPRAILIIFLDSFQNQKKPKGLIKVISPLDKVKPTPSQRALSELMKYMLFSFLLTVFSYFMYDGKDLQNKFKKRKI